MNVPKRTSEAYVGVGSNLGDREGTIRRALRRLGRRPGVDVVEVSPLYETEPRIVEDQPVFINACAKIETRLPPRKLLEVLLKIETGLGRTRRRDKGSRPIDLDILFYDDQVIHGLELDIPHPGIPDRAFVLEPLADIAADLVHPELDETVQQLRDACEDTGWLRKLDE